MTTQTIISADTLRSVIEHMNEDHADACLTIVQTLGKRQAAQTAHMISMDDSGVDFSIQTGECDSEKVRVLFDKKITQEAQIRGRIVSLAKRAKAMQTATQ